MTNYWCAKVKNWLCQGSRIWPKCDVTRRQRPFRALILFTLQRNKCGHFSMYMYIFWTLCLDNLKLLLLANDYHWTANVVFSSKISPIQISFDVWATEIKNISKNKKRFDLLYHLSCIQLLPKSYALYCILPIYCYRGSMYFMYPFWRSMWL